MVTGSISEHQLASRNILRRMGILLFEGEWLVALQGRRVDGEARVEARGSHRRDDVKPIM